MPWVKMDDKHPEATAIVGDDGGWLHFCAICFCSRNLTDGFVPDGALPRLTGLPDPVEIAGRLEGVGLFKRDNRRGGWLVVDYLDHQSSRAEVEERKAKDRNRKPSRFRTDSKRSPSPTPTPTPTPPTNTSTGSDDVAPAPGTTNGPPLAQDPAEWEVLAETVVEVLCGIAESRPGALAPTVEGITRAFRAFPDRDFLPVALDYSHYLLDGAGSQRKIKDVLRGYRRQLDMASPVGAKTQPAPAPGTVPTGPSFRRPRGTRGKEQTDAHLRPLVAAAFEEAGVSLAFIEDVVFRSEDTRLVVTGGSGRALSTLQTRCVVLLTASTGTDSVVWERPEA